MARLLAAARDRWALFDGWALTALQGGDPLDLPPDRFFNLLYFWMVDGADPGQIPAFDRWLWRPPKGVAAPAGTPWSPEAETRAFASLAAEVKGAPVQVR